MKIAACGPRVLVLAGLVLVASACGGGVATASTRAPYSDPNAVGYVGLCNKAGQQITSGNVNTTPFAWRAVSSQAASAPYNNDWRTAILLAYQPRQGLVAGEWSGDELTASARYSNPSHPMTAATGGDDSLADFIQEFHPVWEGFLELRIYLGTRDAEVYSEHYPALDIQVTGSAWHAVGGGRVNCHSGTAESIESIVLPKSATSPSSTTITSTTDSGGSGASGGTKTSSGADASGTTSPSGATKTSSDGNTNSAAGALATTTAATSHPPLALILLAVLLVLLGTSGVLIFRRRRPATDPPASAPVRHSSTKGPRS
jgi:hypothetical protein